MQIRKLMIGSDCRMAVDMINRRCAIPTEYKKLVAQIQYLMKPDWDTNLSHTFYRANQGADFLAKLATHNAKGLHVLDSPPPEVM